MWDLVPREDAIPVGGRGWGRGLSSVPAMTPGARHLREELS